MGRRSAEVIEGALGQTVGRAPGNIFGLVFRFAADAHQDNARRLQYADLVALEAIRAHLVRKLPRARLITQSGTSRSARGARSSHRS